MEAMSGVRSIENIVEEVVKAQFSGAPITSVATVEDFDSGGDKVLRVTVVYDLNDALLDSDKMAGLVGRLRTELAGAQTDMFPLVNFVAKKEMARLKREIV